MNAEVVGDDGVHVYGSGLVASIGAHAGTTIIECKNTYIVLWMRKHVVEY